MKTPKRIRWLDESETVKRGDFIRQGDCGFEYSDFGIHVDTLCRRRKINRLGRWLAWLDSWGGREGFGLMARWGCR